MIIYSYTYLLKYLKTKNVCSGCAFKKFYNKEVVEWYGDDPKSNIPAIV